MGAVVQAPMVMLSRQGSCRPFNGIIMGYVGFGADDCVLCTGTWSIRKLF
jgi:hypothetical protein